MKKFSFLVCLVLSVIPATVLLSNQLDPVVCGEHSVFKKKPILRESYAVICDYFATQSSRESTSFTHLSEWMFVKSSPSAEVSLKLVELLKPLIEHKEIPAVVRVSAQNILSEIDLIASAKAIDSIFKIIAVIFVAWMIYRVWPTSPKNEKAVLEDEKVYCDTLKKGLDDTATGALVRNNEALADALNNEWIKIKDSSEKKKWYFKSIKEVMRQHVLPKNALRYLDASLKAEIITEFSADFGDVAKVLDYLTESWPHDFDNASMNAFYNRMAGYKYLLNNGSAEVCNSLVFHMMPVYRVMMHAAAKSEAATSATA
jgi:hypothetical protein